ncbi:MAG: PIN domain-containing protein [Thiohalocapsa sp.]|uniref:PIN domain-containing protein n=1 Tax=Thiohalocapsa sp. TaxID=2497641 RepID=UPI0025EFD91A|nr:PIN domain-containing protein [Thiohalocapsa sp.]MCG6942239.1 PIN domain-containing protein [Thiohalocapsa sp.]
MLFAEELAKHHPQLPEIGLELLTLGAPAITETLALTARYAGPGVSLNDLMTLALARQERCPVLTGDRVLRRIAGDEGVAVMGRLWLMERLVAGEVIGIGEAEAAYARMRAGGRRLPWDQVQRQIDRLGGGDF